MKPGAENQRAPAHILVCFALKEEAKPFRKLMAEKSGVAILITGIGRQNAEKSVRGFLVGKDSTDGSAIQLPKSPTGPGGIGGITLLPDLVLTCGFAGGLNPDLKTGDVVFETADDDLRGRMLSAGANAAAF